MEIRKMSMNMRKTNIERQIERSESERSTFWLPSHSTRGPRFKRWEFQFYRPVRKLRKYGAPKLRVSKPEIPNMQIGQPIRAS